MQLGAVVRLDRGFPLVATADDTFRAEHAVGFRQVARWGRGPAACRGRSCGGAPRSGTISASSGACSHRPSLSVARPCPRERGCLLQRR